MDLLQLCLSTALLYILAHYFYTYQRLSAFPGPFVAKFTNWWRVYQYRKGNYAETLLELHEKYGPLVRVGPNDLSVGDAMSVPKVYGVKPALSKGRIYKFGTSWYKGQNVSGLEATVDEKEHDLLRKAFTRSFSVTSIEKYEPILDECTRRLVEQVEDEKGDFDMVKWLEGYSEDVINSIAFSAPPQYLNRKINKITTEERGTILKQATILAARMFPLSGLFQWMTWALSYFVDLRRQLLAVGLERIDTRIKQKKSADEQEHDHDLLDSFLRVRQQKPEVMSHEKVLSMTLSVILAGSDTVSSSLISILHELLQHPDILRRLQDELDQASLVSQSDLLTLKELSGLPYLNMIIKEGLRLTTLTHFVMERVVPNGGIVLSGQHVPEGTHIGSLPKVTNSDSLVYGVDAGVFRPERWETSEEQRKTMERCGLWFGGGNHNCIGQHVAMAEMRKALASILMRYEISKVHADQPLSWYTAATIRFPDAPYYVSLKPRQLFPNP